MRWHALFGANNAIQFQPQNCVQFNFDKSQSYAQFLRSSPVLQKEVHKFTGAKAAHKIMLKLTSGVNFIIVLQSAFMLADTKSAKKIVKLISFFELLGSACVKAARKHVGEIDFRSERET